MTFLLFITIMFWAFALWDGWRGLRSIQDLRNIKRQSSKQFVSVIVAAKDEECAIDKTLQSLASQTHEFLEIIAVNDRSEDNTGSIMKKWENKLPLQVKTITIETLPEGWLGKNHALYKGYQEAEGDVIVFTDGDIQFSESAIERALSFLEQEKADHLTVAPNLVTKSKGLKAFISYFMFGFGFFKRPWTANNDHSQKGGMGIGAFNMLKRPTYEAIGTHELIAKRPDDDLFLGQKVKSLGYKQRLATGMEDISVEWYSSLQEAIKGLEKNTFAGLNYSFLLSIVAVIGTFTSQVFPFITLLFSTYTNRALSLIAITLMCTLMAITTKKLTQFKTIYALTLPYSALLFIYTIGRAVSLTIKRGGIEWRGTFYSLKELKDAHKEQLKSKH
ncbi:glycosyl transferase [Pontibacillus chungwhensis BH030062]|uniref:Glycosyl transferase n=1 Tax=Pontibacillus chungwhensis BH030062 TaxID=1385513 RepID=A0A0A2UZ69_9BACI|nr:glycosyltransferase family 2 protein [Pontibacillus chungwhensis]KGP93224.1 glycosyl transferase [Pontibacillus chungwhensis BH030062]